MPKAIWFKFYAGDYITDAKVDGLPLDAQGILIRMWAVVWMEGFLPNDVEDLARKCKVRLSLMQKHLPLLLQFFVKQPDGTYISVRMERERRQSMKTSEERSKAANVRWNKADNANANAGRFPKYTAKNNAFKDAVRSQKSETTKTLPPTPLPGGVEEDFQKTKEVLKTDLSTTYVNSRNFEECAYDRYFRDACLVNEADGVIFLTGPDEALLAEGLGKLGRRLSTTFEKVSGRRVAFEVLRSEGDRA